MENLTIRIAETEEELNEVYRLRYKVFTLEEGDYRYSDTDKETFKDTTDNGKHIVFVAYHYNNLVGTSKLAYRKTEPFPKDEIYNFKELADILLITYEDVIQNTALLERMVVDKQYRKKGIATELFNYMVAQAACDNIKYIVIAVKKDYIQAIKHWQNLGFNFYKEKSIIGEYTFEAMYKVL